MNLKHLLPFVALHDVGELIRQHRAQELQVLRDQAFVLKANLRFLKALAKEPESTPAPPSVAPPREGSFARKVYDQFNGVPRSSVDVARTLKLDSTRVGFTTAQLHKRGYLRRVSPRHYTHAVAVAAAVLCLAFSVCAQPVLPTAVVVPDTNTIDG